VPGGRHNNAVFRDALLIKSLPAQAYNRRVTMKNFWFVFFAVLVACVLLSCTGNKDNGSAPKTPSYDTEIRIIKDSTDALITYKQQINKDQLDIKQVTRANTELLAKLKKLLPQIEVVTRNNPDWETAAPDKVAPFVANYIEENQTFTKDTLKKATDFIGKHSDDKELMDSFDKLKAFLTPRSQD
jgi:hypothetical protein